MNDDDRLLRAADPAPASRVSGLAQPLDELRDAIVGTRRPVAAPRRWLSAAVMAAVIVGAGAVLVPRVLRDDRVIAPAAAGGRAAACTPTDSASAAGPDAATGAAVTPADAAGLDPGIPRLLLPSPWRVTPLEDDLTAREGQIGFTDGDQTVTLYWYSDQPADALDDTVGQSDPLRTTVTGDDAYVFDDDHRTPDEEPSPGQVLAFWQDGDTVYAARGRSTTPDGAAAFAEILAQLAQVDAPTWLAALPADAVTPAERRAMVDEMRRGIPVPPGIDVDALGSDGRIGAGRYQVGATVTGAVACGWIERWLAATEADDQAAARRAARAMQTSHDWDVLHECRRRGRGPTSCGSMPTRCARVSRWWVAVS